MKKSIVCIALAFAAIFGKADTVTNTVVIVSNFYNNVYHESVVTQKVKNTHVNYYFTNNVYTVSNRTFVVSQTNLNVNVINTNFGPWIAKCETAANNAQSSASAASSSSSDAASSASSASSSASSASSSANSAAASASSASSAASDGLRRINERIQWFDDHSGETITNINITTNMYYAEDSTARAGVSSNASAISANATAISSVCGRVATLESDAYASDPSYGGVYVYHFKIGTTVARVTIDTTLYPNTMSTGDGTGYLYYRSWSQVDNPCTVEFLSGTPATPRIIICRNITGSNQGKLKVTFYQGTYVLSTDTSMSQSVMPTNFASSYNYLESVTYVKKKMTVWTQEKLDAMTSWVNGLVSSLSSRCSAIETNFGRYNSEVTSITNRIKVLEGFHGVTPDPPAPSQTPAYYVYNVMKDNVQIGTMTVNVKSPTRQSSEWTDTYFYVYTVSKTWTDSLPTPTAKKGFPKDGYTWQPWTWLVFGSNSYQIQSRNTGTDEHSYFTGSESLTYGSYTYTFTLDHIDYE